MSKVEQSDIRINMFPIDDSLSGVRKLFPELRDTQFEQVKEVLEGYASVVWQIYEQLERENPEILDELVTKAAERKKQENQIRAGTDSGRDGCLIVFPYGTELSTS